MVFVVTAAYVKAVEQLRDRLVMELEDKIESIVLYGSVAKERADEESDIDILVVTQEDEKGLYDKISRIRTRVDLENNTLTAILYVTSAELEHYAKLGSPFVKSVSEEGVILFDRGAFKKLCGSLAEKS